MRQSDPLPMQCYSIANTIPIHCQSDVYPLSIWCQSYANTSPISYQFVPIHSQAYTDPCQSIVNHITIDCQSDYNSVPIRLQSKATHLTPLRDHSIDNLIKYPDSMSNKVIQCQSTTNLPIQANLSKPIRCKSYNLMSIQNQSNTKQIQQSNSNHDPINQSITNSLHIRQSNNCQPILAEPNIPQHSDNRGHSNHPL